MARAPYQVLVIPYRHKAGRLLVAVMKIKGHELWQFIAGGGEATEDPLDAAKREALEEGGISSDRWLALDAKASIPRIHFKNTQHWDPAIFVIPEHAFAVRMEETQELRLSGEHSEFVWLAEEAAAKILAFDSNRVALWELGARLA